MNEKLLKSKMVLYGDEDFTSAIAELLEVTRQTASSKLKGLSKFTQPEIAIISRHYGLTDEEIRKIFIEDGSTDESERSSKDVR